MPPSPDDVALNVLKAVFGSSSIIVTLFVVAKLINDWLDALKTATEWGRKTQKFTSGVYRRLRGIGPVQMVMASIITTLLLIVQALWLGLSYIIGNGVSLFALDRPVHNGPHWAEFLTSLRWDVVSGAFVAVAFVALVVEYRRLNKGARENLMFRVLMVPLAFFGGLCALAALLGALMWALLNWKPDPNIDITAAWAGHFGIQSGSVAAVALVYAVATSVVLRTPILIKESWRQPAVPSGARAFPYS